jgi:hypothetical protein
MTALPTHLGVIIIGSCLRDPGQFWGAGPTAHAEALPPRPCPDCHGRGWVAVPDPFLGGHLDTRCACGGGR